jgi:glycine hydroxymethyltransferase
MMQVQQNATAMAKAFVDLDYNLISGGTDNHMMLIDLRNKSLTGKIGEEALGKAGITVNKNMVPFDTESPFVTSGIRVGTAAITTRGLTETEMPMIVDFINRVIQNPENDHQLGLIKREVEDMMGHRPLFVEQVMA